MRWSKKWF